MKRIELMNVFEYKDIEKYVEFLNEFDIEKFKRLSRDEQNLQITILSDKLMKLYGEKTKARNKYLEEECGCKYEDCKEVILHVDSKIFDLEEKYFKLIQELYDIVSKQFCFENKFI